jgi:hypothetical protein
LNKILKAGRYYKDSEKTKKPFMVVRAEVSNAAELNADIIPQQAPSPDHGGDSDDEMLIADPVTGDEEDIGLGVARELANKTSKVRFRGTITKYHDDDKNPECDPSGTFFVKFSDGRKLTMDADQVNHGRRKFEKEVNRNFVSLFSTMEKKIPKSTSVTLNRNSWMLCRNQLLGSVFGETAFTK